VKYATLNEQLPNTIFCQVTHKATGKNNYKEVKSYPIYADFVYEAKDGPEALNIIKTEDITLTTAPKVLSRPLITGIFVIKEAIPLKILKANLNKRKIAIILIIFITTSVIPSEIPTNKSSIVETLYLFNIASRFSIAVPS
jgi:hypothetical protein